MKLRVPLYGAVGKVVWVDDEATKGAVVGTNLYLSDGKTLVTEAMLTGGGTNASGTSPDLGTTDQLSEGQFHLYFTDLRAQDAVGGILADSANITLHYDAGASITADLTDVTPTSGGALKKRAFDAKGRLSQESAATTDDLGEGASNLYFTSARVLATTLTGLSTSTSSPVSASDSVLVGIGKLQAQVNTNATAIAGKEPAIASGTAAQYWRGDKSWRDFATDVRAAVVDSSFKNRLINGDFSINQRGFAGGALAAGVYGYDRWKAGTGGCNASLSSGVLTHTSGPLVQVLEAPNLAGQTVVVSVENPSGSITVNIDGITGTITSGSGRRGVSLTVPSGSTGNVTLTLTAAGVTYGRVQLEIGAAATAWDQRHPAQEVALCQRYFEKSYGLGTAPGSITQSGDFAVFVSGLPVGTYSSGSNVIFKVSKASSPSVTVYSTTTGTAGKARDINNNADVSASISNLGLNGYFCFAASAGSATGYNLQWQWTADAEL